MRFKLISLVTILGMLFPITIEAKGKQPENQSWKEKDGLYAIFQTSKGEIVCELFEKQAPKTVDNFVGLAKGKKEWTDFKTKKKMKTKFYDGLTFHRVIPKFMIQGGCPRGDGRGGPGYRFEDEIVTALKFDKPGMLAMANSGPNTNGSQFFITEEPTPWLNGRHTIFGEVVEGLGVVKNIARVPRDSSDKPQEAVLINKVIIKRVGKKMKKSKVSGSAKMKLSAKKALFIVAPRNFRDEEYFEPKKILTDAGVKVITASLTMGELTGVMGGKTNSEIVLSKADANDYDAVVFIGGPGAYVYFENPAAHKITKDAAKNGKIIGAICIAPTTIAKAGVLKGKKATGFSSVKSELTSNDAEFINAPVVEDGKIITASGPEAAKDFGFALLRALNR
ncbi:MAG: peptidylprolyl isomerase [Endomicrobiales bacterium]|nr:peptidylprolyl isomerase [Endomicrobiales bacterium]